MIDHTQDIAARERHTRNLLIPFAIAILLALAIWLAFTRYV